MLLMAILFHKGLAAFALGCLFLEASALRLLRCEPHFEVLRAGCGNTRAEDGVAQRERGLRQAKRDANRGHRGRHRYIAASWR